MRTYPIHSMFLTLQGEGCFAGNRAVFIRTAGCNVWSGNPQDRARDASRGCCAAWCDTEFRGTGGRNGGRLTASEVAAKARELWRNADDGLVVLTGGEPGLVVDDDLVDALHAVRLRAHMETNGSKLVPQALDWVTLSPKPPMPVLEQRYDEVKVIFPAVDPTHWARYAPYRYVQPLDQGPMHPNVSAAVQFILGHPEWRLSLQMHKAIGVP